MDSDGRIDAWNGADGFQKTSYLTYKDEIWCSFCELGEEIWPCDIESALYFKTNILIIYVRWTYLHTQHTI